MGRLDEILDNHIEGGAGAWKNLYDDIEIYAKECVIASLDNAANKATLLIELKSGSGKFRKGQLAYIADDHDHFEVDKQSITAQENIILL